MAEETEEKKSGFFGKLMKIAFIAAIVAAVVAIFKRRRGKDLEEDEWQELRLRRRVSPTLPAASSARAPHGPFVAPIRRRILRAVMQEAGAARAEPHGAGARAPGGGRERRERRRFESLEDADPDPGAAATWGAMSRSPGIDPRARRQRERADPGVRRAGRDRVRDRVERRRARGRPPRALAHARRAAGRRHRGVGFALKLAHARSRSSRDRRGALDVRPADRAERVLQPPQAGAVADRFERNHYGEMSDEVNAGERSDRFTVRWDLARAGPRAVEGDAALEPAGEGRRSPIAGREGGVGRRPARLRKSSAGAEPSVSSAWRDASAAAIESCLGAGMRPRAFDAEGSRYLFVARRTPE